LQLRKKQRKYPIARPPKKPEINLDGVQLLTERGLTDKQIATVYNITEQTVNNWKKSNPEFFESLKDGKAVADDKVQNSLFKKACGFTDDSGRYYPPDTTAGIFWLKNRRQAEWREKTEVDNSHSYPDKITIEYIPSTEKRPEGQD